MIGVLALQGAFQKHAECLEKLQVSWKLIRHPHELKDCLGLILPGGETTAHQRLLTENFWDALIKFGKSKPIFGTCCGLILLSKEIVGQSFRTLGFLDIKVQRNAYGNQVESFEEKISVFLNGKESQIKGCFIRAPKIVDVSSTVKVLAKHQGVPVIIESGLHLATSFHPEISKDITLHEYFTQKCLNQTKVQTKVSSPF